MQYKIGAFLRGLALITVIAIVGSGCRGKAGALSAPLELADSGGTPGGTTGSIPDGGPQGTTGGNPALVSKNAAADPNYLALCVVGNPTLLKSGRPATVLQGKVFSSQIQPFDLVTGETPVRLIGYADGVYDGLVLTLSTGCGGISPFSLEVANRISGATTYQTSVGLTMVFDGKFMVYGPTTLQLNARTFLRALANVSSGEQIQKAISLNTGTLR